MSKPVKVLVIIGVTGGVVVLILACSGVLTFWHKREISKRLHEERAKVADVMYRVGNNGGGGVSSYDDVGPFDELEYRFRHATDADLRHLDDLEGLTMMEITGFDMSETPITDGGLIHVGRLASLVYLQLADTNITDAGLEKLSGLRNLEVLDLTNTKVTQDGAKHLQKLPMLKRVYAAGTTLKTLEGVEVDLSPRSPEHKSFFSKRPDLLRAPLSARARAAQAAEAKKAK
jgi:hypothetical protein